MELLKLRKGAYEYYRKNVKGNENIDYELAKLKLNRNILLGREMPILEDRPQRLLYYYGNLAIVVEGDEIVWLKNYTDRKRKLYIDWNEYNRLNRELGIDTYYREKLALNA